MSASCKKCWYKPSLFANMDCIAGQNPDTCAMPENKRNFQQPPPIDTDFLFTSPDDKGCTLRRYKELLSEIYDADD